MEPKARYAKELQLTKQNRTRQILESAERVFTVKGIENATMLDVAKEAQLGVATVFRFFPRKDKLIAAVAAGKLEVVLKSFREIAARPASCLEKVEALFDNSITMLHDQDAHSVKLLENFENYVAHYDEPLEDIESFNAVYREISKTFASIVEQGVRDGSVRPDLDVRETLITLVNAFSIFARKLSLQKNILIVEQDMPAEDQLVILKRMFIGYLRG